jgi:hypothetical protein
MKLIRAVAIFCEDLREERSSQDILLGIMSDNLALPSAPVIMPRLAVYLRAYFDVASKPQAIKAWVQFPWDQRIDLGDADASLVEAALGQARERGNPLAGVILKGLFSPLVVKSFGATTVHIKIGREENLCGMLNFFEDPTLKASVSTQPA